MKATQSNTYNIKAPPTAGNDFSLPLPEEGDPISPYPWQVDAIEKFERDGSLAKRLAAFVAPGGGKTKLTQFILTKWKELFPIKLVASPRNGINEQWVKQESTVYGEWAVSATHQFFDGDDSVQRLIKALKNRWANPDGALVTSHATLRAAYDERPDVFDFDNMCFVGDEIHHAGDTDLGEIWRKAAASKGWMIGLTGTPPDNTRREFREFGFIIYRREMYEHLSDIKITHVNSYVFEFIDNPIEVIVNNLDPEYARALVVVPSDKAFWRYKSSGWSEEQLVEEFIRLLLVRGFKREEIADTITQNSKREKLLKDLKLPGNPLGYKVVLTNKFITEGIDLSWLREAHISSGCNSYVYSRQVEGRLTRGEEGKDELSYFYYVPAFCDDPNKLEFYEDRINAGIISSFSEDLIPELAKLKYPRIHTPEEPEDEDEEPTKVDDDDDDNLTPREAFGDDAWQQAIKVGIENIHFLPPFKTQEEETIRAREVIRDAVESVVKDRRIKLKISIEDAVDAVYRYVKIAIYQEKAKSAKVSLDVFMESLHSSNEFPHLLAHETFMGISHTPEVLKQMHRAYLSHKGKEWDDHFEVFKAKKNLVKFVWKERENRLKRSALANRGVTADKLEIVGWGKDQYRSMEQGKLSASQTQRFSDLMKEIQQEEDNKPKPVVVETPEMKKVASQPTPRSFGYR